MPDLTIEIMQQCSNMEGHGGFGGYHQYASLYPTSRHTENCTCEGFKFRGDCKHINLAREKLCNYHEQVDGSPDVDGVCPRCGSPTEYVRVGV